jgi:putative Mn2+ efflux pump MntP
VENNQQNYYTKTYIPSIIKWGKLTMLLGILLCFGPALVISGIYGYMPPISAIIAGTISQISVSGAFYVVEPISYFPILGIPGTYLTFLSGNTSNMRVPCASVAQEAAGVEMGTEKGSVISTIGIAVSILVNIVILTLGAVGGNAILAILPVGVQNALNFLLPALYGAVFGQFAIARPKLAVIAVVIAFGMNWLLKNGFLAFLPGTPSYAVILVAVFGSIFAGKLLYKKELVED